MFFCTPSDLKRKLEVSFFSLFFLNKKIQSLPVGYSVTGRNSEKNVMKVEPFLCKTQNYNKKFDKKYIFIKASKISPA